MTVKEVVTLAANLLGRDDLAAFVVTGAPSESDEAAELDSLLRCYNLVENEASIDYFPLRARETLSVQNGSIAFERFTRKPVRIEKVTVSGKIARYTLFPDGIYLTDGADEATVTYAYAPVPKTYSDESECAAAISARCLAYGVAGEFYLIGGESGRASMWLKRYYDALRACGSGGKTLRIRSRRWE